MPTYITMLKWTSQGLQNVKQSPSRLDAARKAFESGGTKMKDFYMVTGQYDMIAVVEAPDELHRLFAPCTAIDELVSID